MHSLTGHSLKEMDLPELLDVCLDVDNIPAEERLRVREHVASLLPTLNLHNYKDLTWEQQLCLKTIANPPVRTGGPLKPYESDYVRK